MSSSLLLFPQRFGRCVLRPSSGVCCLNFWDEDWWFLSLRIFGLLSLSLLLFPQCPPAFFRCLSNSGTYTEIRTTSFIESTGVASFDSVNHNRVQVLSIRVLLLACSQKLRETTPITVTLCVLLNFGSLSFEGDNHLEVTGSILTAGELQYRNT